MTNLEKLEADIRGKLTRLMELTEGCLIKRGKFTERITFVERSDLVATITIEVGYSDSNWRSISEINKLFTIIGHDPKLNDVLEWIGIKYSDDIEIDCTGQFSKYNYEYESFQYESDWKWDLSKFLLKDQSQELIDYLAGLI